MNKKALRNGKINIGVRLRAISSIARGSFIPKIILAGGIIFASLIVLLDTGSSLSLRLVFGFMLIFSAIYHYFTAKKKKIQEHTIIEYI